MAKKETTYTPMMQQYLEIKKDYADAIVFFRLGDFYEMFFEDAIIASKTLEIALTGRDAGVEQRVPMCGVPHHAVIPYAQRLIQNGFKIAIVEQVTEPGNGLVKREVVKLITPGMIMDEGILNASTYNYIGAISQEHTVFNLAYADLSTGDLSVEVDLTEDELMSEIVRLDLKEVVLEASDKRLFNKLEKFVLLSKTDHVLEHELNQSIGIKAHKASGLLLNYLKQTQKNDLEQFHEIRVLEKNGFLNMDNHSRVSLELTDTYSKQKGSTLFEVLDHCVTALGSRLLRKYMDEPSINQEIIENRFDAIVAMQSSMMSLEQLKESLKGVYDLRRITTRIATKNANGKDLAQLRQTLSRVPAIKQALESFNHPLLDDYNEKISALEDLKTLLERSIESDPPLTIKEGGLIKFGYDKTLDELKNASKDGKNWMVQFEAKERERTGIKNLKIGYNRVFGYYIEITKGNLDMVNDSFGYQRKQTLSTAERFITEDLKEKETFILTAGEKEVALEYELFIQIRDLVAKSTKNLQKLSDQIAYIDVISNLAMVAKKNRYVRPSFTSDKTVRIKNGRHAVVEQALKGDFVQNDVSIDQNGILLITGPNMSGKSTYMRMFAQHVIMAQMGCFVPADLAIMPIFDQVFTRIGASDDLTLGQSTFMVEMLETNDAIKHATENSLLIFDEIGRGTATYDGMALAQAIIEYVHEKIKCITLFSTHYHELTILETSLKRLKNIHVMAAEEKRTIVFLHKIKEGPTDKSYGINVAELAKLPRPLIRRAEEILTHLEKDKKQTALINLFNFDEKEDYNYVSSKEEMVLNQLKALEINELSPLEALLLVKKLQDELE
ncbi:MAG: DNA mismatch repair protein MutS [Acholeplasma sp.]|nr:DNA mismatch repair protein MutS [Acholeplasma sp.]